MVGCELERAVLQQFGVQAAVGGKVDVLEEMPYIVGCTGAPGFCVSTVRV
jgi:hypothetical protein